MLLGIRATPGGQHPGGGTRNALVSLGRASYLEIIGPDPAQPAPAQRRKFGIDELTTPRLVAWATATSDLHRVARDAARHGVALGPVTGASRRTPDGALLAWTFTDPATVVADGIVPFFIDWGRTTHPATTTTQAVQLVSLAAEHPDPSRVQAMLNDLGLELTVSKGPRPALIALIDCPRGRVELR
jgi:hypothetical protein